MSFMNRAKDLVRNFQSSQSPGFSPDEEEATERSLCWKADFGQDSSVKTNFYHEVGNHGYVSQPLARLLRGDGCCFNRVYSPSASGGETTRPKITSIHLPTRSTATTPLQMETRQPKRLSYEQSSTTLHTIKPTRRTLLHVFPPTKGSVDHVATSQHV
jgi:hypothetical protein